jgi:hypothetical protein
MMSYWDGVVRFADSAQMTVLPLPDCCCAGATTRTGAELASGITGLELMKGITFVACIDQQLVQLSQISASESIIVTHEDLECI